MFLRSSIPSISEKLIRLIGFKKINLIIST